MILVVHLGLQAGTYLRNFAPALASVLLSPHFHQSCGQKIASQKETSLTTHPSFSRPFILLLISTTEQLELDMEQQTGSK